MMREFYIPGTIEGAEYINHDANKEAVRQEAVNAGLDVADVRLVSVEDAAYGYGHRTNAHVKVVYEVVPVGAEPVKTSKHAAKADED